MIASRAHRIPDRLWFSIGIRIRFANAVAPFGFTVQWVVSRNAADSYYLRDLSTTELSPEGTEAVAAHQIRNRYDRQA